MQQRRDEHDLELFLEACTKFIYLLVSVPLVAYIYPFFIDWVVYIESDIPGEVRL